MMRAAHSAVPSILRYLYQYYSSVGKLWMLDSGELVEAFDCGGGIWQGDPLGNSCFSLAIFEFMELLRAQLRPEASQCRPSAVYILSASEWQIGGRHQVIQS